jgi:hypothetical protein
VVVLLPILGTLIYWFRRPMLEGEREREIARQTRPRR